MIARHTGRDAAFIAVDLGATSGRVMLGHVAPDDLRLEHVTRFANELVATADGLHWDILGLYSETLRGVRQALRTDHPIRSIGVDAWGVDYGLMRGGRLLGVPFHYRDERTAHGYAAVSSRVAPADLYARNGLQQLPINTLYQLASEPPEFLRLADSMLLIPDLFGYWMTGCARSERTIASTTGLLDPRDAGWDAELLALLGLPADILPPLITAGERLGALRPEVTTAVHGGEDVPVIAVGSHDTASAVVATPMQTSSAAYIACGTWGLVGVEVERPVLTRRAASGDFSNEGGVDGRILLQRNSMGLWLLSETIRGWERADARALDLPALLAAAAAVDPADVPCFDVNDPVFVAPGDLPARIDAWCASRGISSPRSRVEYVRAIIESLARAFADSALEAGDLARIAVRTIHVIGGGARNELLCQRIADRAGIMVLAGPAEATAIGNVLVQARAAGVIHGPLEALRGFVAATAAPRAYLPVRARLL